MASFKGTGKGFSSSQLSKGCFRTSPVVSYVKRSYSNDTPRPSLDDSKLTYLVMLGTVLVMGISFYASAFLRTHLDNLEVNYGQPREQTERYSSS